MKKIASLFIIFVFCLQSYSQTIKGKIIDKATTESLPYVTVSIKGTTFGVASDMKGEFELNIPTEHSNGILVIACVGYESLNFQIKKLLNEKPQIIELSAKNTQLNEVIVTDKNMQPYTIIRNAISAIAKNYVSKPYNYDFYYHNEFEQSNSSAQKREAIIMFYDNRGYTRTNAFQTFKDCNYKIVQAKRNFKIKGLREGMTNIDDMLEFDIVRNTGNLLDANRLFDFEVTITQETIFEGDSVWMLTYNCKKPALINTGDFYVKEYKGDIYIKKSDYAIVYNKTTVRSGNISYLNRSLYQNQQKQEIITNSANYDFEVKYTKSAGFYTLKSIKHNQTLELTENKIGTKKTEKTKTNLFVRKISTEQLEKINKRVYFENINQNNSFWNSFVNNY